MGRYGSRKFIVALATLGSATWLVAAKLIADGVYSAVVLGVVVAYMTANTIQKNQAAKP